MPQDKLDKLIDSVTEMKTDVAVIKSTQEAHTKRFDQHEAQTTEKVKEIKDTIRWGLGIAVMIVIAVVAGAWAVFVHFDSKNLNDATIKLEQID